MLQKRRAILACLCFIFPIPLSAFVLLSGPQQAILPVSLNTPVVFFYWDGNAPTFTGVDDYLGGRWEGLESADVMQQALLFAFNVWNEVPGSYVQLKLSIKPGVTLDSSDNVNAIVIASSNSLSTAAFAIPTIRNRTIEDCDISILNSTVTVEEFVYRVIHEMGHCLGLGHSHTNYNAIMGYARISERPRLGADDMAGISYLYPDPAYTDRKAKGLLGCGVITREKGTKTADQSRNLFVTLSFFLPLLLLFFRPRRKDH